MGNFIDRNTDDMRAFVKSVKEYVGNMTMLMRTAQGLLSSYEADLDNNCKECIAKFKDCCTTFLKQIDSYNELAKLMERKAAAQDAAKNIRF
ncbi:hypothetical protein [Proteiniborus sp.]|uniref:hypothetical protein n=1 Tax=Proteiniborus sp. TaxID=2079015 RepID=UPI0033297F4F